MICPKCGGNISVNENCSKCGVSYDKMIDDISHDEMIRLLNRIYELMSQHKNIEIEASLLACELVNSSLLVPVDMHDDHMSVAGVQNFNGKKFIMLFTDSEEYDKCNFNYKPRTNPFYRILELLEDDLDGFVINAGSMQCELSREYLKTYFDVS